MQKKYNDLVTFVRNGSAIPAFVVNSQLQPNGKEYLSLLYADPATGPSLVLAGATRKVGDVALSVAPMSPGAAFGWFDLPVADSHADVLEDHADARAAGEVPPAIPPAVIGNPGVHVPVAERQALESDSDKAARLANVEHQNPQVIHVPVPTEAKLDTGEVVPTEKGPDGTLIEVPGAELKVGDSVYVIDSDGRINLKPLPISAITPESPDGPIYFVEGGDIKGYFRDRVIRVGTNVPTYPGAQPNLASPQATTNVEDQEWIRQHDIQLAKDIETAKSASFHVVEQPDGSFVSSVGPSPAPIVPDRTSHDDVTAASLASKINASLGK